MPRTPEGPWQRADRPGWWYKHGGKRRRLNIPDDASKTTARRAWLEAVSTPPAPAIAETSLRSIMEQFLSPRKGKADFHYYACPMASFVKFVQDAPPETLTNNHVTRWLQAQDTWGQTMRCNAVTAIKQILNWAVNEGLLKLNPIKTASKPARLKRHFTFSASQAMLAISAAQGTPFEAFIVALYHTGARPSELARATRENASQDGFIYLPTGKQGARTIWLPENLRDWFARLRQAAKPNGPLFPDAKGRHFTKRIWCLEWNKVRKAAELPTEATPYQFRHTFITRQASAGVPLAIIATAVGTSISMISARYSKLKPSDVAGWLGRFQ